MLFRSDIKYRFNQAFEQITHKSKKYISKCFKIGLSLINSKKSEIIVNGPISKRHFLGNSFPGITEYIFNKSKKKISLNPVMIIFNNKISVSPITTHIDLKDVHKKIKEKVIINNVLQINSFYEKKLKLKPKIAILGLNPHCESKSKNNEEITIIKPAIKK